MDREIQRQKFLDNNILYDEIDPEMINIIDVLNFKCGYKTKYCCYGHSHNEFPDIMFDSCISDEMIYKLIEYLHQTKDFWYNGNKNCTYDGNFKKWARCIDGKLAVNWVWQGCFAVNDKKEEWIKKIYKHLCEFQ